ncbi:MAG TPA: isoamylase early set domain-containing protein [Gemmatimonadales bacterium]|nr:isoamylase early set domain-containing protein [Gemmatimonadales bacterium]
MRAERDDLRDELLGRVAAELRRPVRLDPAVDARVLKVLLVPAPAPRRLPRWAIAAGSGAIAAGLALVTLLHDGGAGRRAVELRVHVPASSQVVVVGDFNDWDPAATPLRPARDGGVWTVELRLPPGRYRYTFLVDGRRWVPDPAEPRVADDDFGAPMSVLTVS